MKPSKTDLHAVVNQLIRYSDDYLLKDGGAANENVEPDAVMVVREALQASAESLSAGGAFNFTIDGAD